MLKSLGIACLFTIATVGFLSCQTAPFGPPKHGIAKASGSQSGRAQTQAQDSEATAPHPTTTAPQPTAPECDEACQQGRQNLAMQGKLELFTGVLAGVGVLQVCLMFWQGWLLHLTRKTIDLQTQAAASTAASFINKERSRLFVSHDITPDFVVTIRAVNRGLSPARVTYKFVGSEFYKTTEAFQPEIPRDTDFEDSPEGHVCDEWVLPGKAIVVGECDNSFISQTENPDLYGIVMRRELVAWYFGIIRWIDSVSEDEHWIRFCYRCHPFESGRHYLSDDGPPAYRGNSDDQP